MIIEDEYGIVLTSKMHEVIKSDDKSDIVNISANLIESLEVDVVEKSLIVNLVHKLKEAGVSLIMQIKFECVFERDGIWWIRYISPKGVVVSESSNSTNPEKARALVEQRKREMI
ncbi:MAG: hypothetical protein AB1422_04945 [bacterium]